LRQAHLFAPSSVTHNAGIGDKNQFQVLTAGQEKFEQTPNSSAQEVFGFWATQLLRCAFGQVTCERLHFLIQYHCNSFDSRSQGPCKGALHGIISQVSSNVPLVVCLGRILSKDKIFHRSNIVFFDRRKCLKIEGYPMESAAKEKQLHKYPARTSPHRTMKP
jgi:hypothetical protein